jgi:hypothetical protein
LYVTRDPETTGRIPLETVVGPDTAEPLLDSVAGAVIAEPEDTLEFEPLSGIVGGLEINDIWGFLLLLFTNIYQKPNLFWIDYCGILRFM